MAISTNVIIAKSIAMKKIEQCIPGTTKTTQQLWNKTRSTDKETQYANPFLMSNSLKVCRVEDNQSAEKLLNVTLRLADKIISILETK